MSLFQKIKGWFRSVDPIPALDPQDFWDGFQAEDGTVNPNHPVFQVGRFLFDAQVLYSDADIERKGCPRESDPHYRPITPERVIELCKRYCQLVNAVGMLKWHYGELLEKVDR